jgi:hypothetical protein
LGGWRWIGFLVAELPSVEFVGVFEPGKFAWLGWKWGGAEIGMLQGVDCVYSLSPVQLQEITQK